MCSSWLCVLSEFHNSSANKAGSQTQMIKTITLFGTWENVNCSEFHFPKNSMFADTRFTHDTDQR
uniref:Uncharacterized protein n=1 Tax=Anguilla anguilla TaxID=7936 RepID=A0A0E9QYC7_ANGAN